MHLKRKNSEGLDAAINRVLLTMQEERPGSNVYSSMVDNLVKLNEIKVNKAKKNLSQDAIATISANIAGLLLILHYERVNVVGTKALTFVQKLR